jgi:hypothetical protein
MLFEHRDDDRWNTVTFLWAGLAPVADVESFIDECINAGTGDLAYGVLYDQYERIPREIRRQLLTEGISKDQIPVQETGQWIYSCPRNLQEKLAVYGFGLRGLSAKGKRDILLKARLDGTLVWSDSANAQKKARDMLWMTFSYPLGIPLEEWKACLASPCPEGGSIAWLLWCIELSFIDVLGNEHPPVLKVLVENFKEACPHARGLVPIALMSAGLTVTRSDRYRLVDLEDLVELLEILPGSDDGEVVPDWLLGTRDWFLGRGRRGLSNEPIEDLLTTFVEQMEELAEQGTLKRDATYERAINFVEELRERREALGDLVVETDDSTSFRRITQ